MAAGPQIVRPPQDRPGLGRLAGVALASLVVGVVLSNASVQRNRWLPHMTHLGERIVVATLTRPPAARDRAAGTNAAPEPLAPTAAPAAPTPAAPAPPDEPPPDGSGSTIAAVVEAPASALGALSAAAPLENPVERRAGRHRVGVTPGRVAYLRCDGAPEQDGLFPCPRDRTLEQRVFAAIDALATCRDLAATTPPPVGRADAWLIFRGPELGGIRMRESPGSEATSEAIRLCLESRLTGVRSRVESDRMTVSFRFDLR